MYRDWKVYIEDIDTAIDKIDRYMVTQSLDSFLENTEKQDAVIRNLEVIGEAAGKVPEEIKARCQYIEWRKITGLRNVLIHEYFGVSIPMVWDIVQSKLPELKNVCLNLLNENT